LMSAASSSTHLAADEFSSLVHQPSRRRSPLVAHLWDRMARGLLLLCALLSISITFSIIFVLFKGTSRFSAMEGVTRSGFLGSTKWSPLFTEEIGIWPLVSGSILVTVVAMVVA